MSFRTLMGWPEQGEGEKSYTPCTEHVKCMVYQISLRPTTQSPTAHRNDMMGKIRINPYLPKAQLKNLGMALAHVAVSWLPPTTSTYCISAGRV